MTGGRWAKVCLDIETLCAALTAGDGWPALALRTSLGIQTDSGGTIELVAICVWVVC